MTIHSFAGLGLADKDALSLIQDIKKYKKAVSRIMNCRTLFIDEISMISGALLDKIDIIFKYFRNNNNPFGGCVIIAVGDALQLPPVFSGTLNEKQQFFFESRSWKEANFHTIELTEVKRQSDKDFIDLLNNLRKGKISNYELLATRFNYKFPESDIKPVKIFSTNKKVNNYNEICLSEIKSPSVFFYALDTGEERHIKSLDKNCPAAKTIELKVGAQVIILANICVLDGFVNGTVGKIIKFEDNKPVIRTSTGKTAIINNWEWEIKEQVFVNEKIEYNVIASRKQIPLKLAYSVTAHRIQGQTLDKVEVDLDNVFEFGQIYVMLSRTRTLEGLSIKNFDPKYIKAHPKCLDFYEKSNRIKDVEEESLL